MMRAEFHSPHALALRTPAFPAALLQELYESEDLFAALQRLLRERGDVRETLRLVSPSLGIGIDRWLAREPHDDDGAAVGALAYLARCCTRPTPLAACAAIGVISEGTAPAIGADARLKRRTRPDCGWLYRVASKYEADIALLPRLRLRPSGMTHVFNGRLEVADMARTHIAAVGQARAVLNVPTALNYTEAVKLAIECCEAGITGADLAERIASRLSVPYDSALPLVAKLLEVGVLISNLRVPLEGDPAAALLSVLRELDAQAAQTLSQVLSLLAQSDAAPIEEAHAFLERASALAAQLAPADHYWQIDSARTYSGSLPGAALEQIARVLEHLAAIADPIRENRVVARLFLEKYNAGREVPLLELLDPAEGLHFEAAIERERSGPERERRAAFFLSLAANAIASGARHVALDGELERLSVKPLPGDYPATMEIICSLAARENGSIGPAFVAGAFNGDGRSLMRFHDILPAGTLAPKYGEDPACVDAELMALPHSRRSANVAVRPRTTEYQILCGVWSGQDLEHTITLDDIVAGVENGEVYVRSKRLGKRLRVQQSHMLNAEVSSRIAKFFHTVCSSDLPAIGFQWPGASRQLPYTPRVSIAGVAVALETWRMPRDLAVKWDTNEAEEWRARWRLPRYVSLTFADNRLLLDLQHDLCTAQIRRAAAKLPEGAHVELQEAFPFFTDAPLDGGYFAELAASYAISWPQALLAPRTIAPAPIVERAEYLRPPGEEWIYLKLYVGAERAGYFIEKRLPALIEAAGPDAELFHFLRYADPGYHVRIRFLIADRERYAGALLRCIGAANELARAGIVGRVVLDTYDREVERYGGTGCIDVAERIFDLSSRIVLGTLANLRGSDDRDVAMLQQVCDFSVGLLGGSEQALHWLKRRLGRRQHLKSDDWKRIRKAGQTSAPDARAAHVLRELGARLRERAPETGLDEIFGALVHMHCNRLGLSPAQEGATLHLVLALLEGVTARQRAG